MIFDSNISLLYSDTLVPDVFITEYLPSLDGDFLKVYIYLIFLCRHEKHANTEDIAKKLELDTLRVKDALTCLEGLGVISRNNSGISLVDLKEKEINRLYRLKTTSTPGEAAFSSERNKKRQNVISSINNAFFQGVMSPAWYTDIDTWFSKYNFEEDVMYALFKHCYDHKALSRPYIVKVADSWYSKNIKNSFDLDKYDMETKKLKEIGNKIRKKLRRTGYLTEYEEAYVEKWVNTYGFGFDIIELALRHTTSAVNPSFEYVNRILTDWYEKGYKTPEQILAAEGIKKSPQGSRAKAKDTAAAIPQKGNFEQRKYDDEYFDKLYKDV